MTLAQSVGVPPGERRKSLQMISEVQENWSVARDIEASIHSISDACSTYQNNIQRIVFNLYNNPALVKLGAEVVLLTDEDMARGTIVEEIEREIRESRERFDQIVQEKYELVNRDTYKATLRCRRCGSGDVQCDQKQTRGADEAMTVFATCQKCNNRWTMR